MRSSLQLGSVAMAALLLVVSAVEVTAAPIVTPPDLNLGDEYRLAFITTETTDAVSDDVGVYNQFVTDRALLQPELAGLGTTWRAIVSTEDVDARDNTLTNPGGPYATDIPIYLLDGNRLVNDYADLWDASIMTNLGIIRDGTQHPSFNPIVWTGTDTDGTEFFDSGASRALGNIANNNPRTGNGNVSDGSLLIGAWISNIDFTDQSNDFLMYGMSDVLTVEDTTSAVPEPSSLALLVIGACGLAAARRRRKPVTGEAPVDVTEV